MVSLNERLGIRWNRVERALAPLGMVLFVYAIYLLGLRYLLSRDDHSRFLNGDVAQAQLHVLGAVLLGALALIGVGLLLRRRRPDSLAFQYLGALYFALTQVWAGNITGTQSITTGVVLIGAALAGYIALERAVIMTGVAVSFILILMLNIAATLDMTPYAPLLKLPITSADQIFQVHIALFLAAPNIVMCLGLITLMIYFWRRREAHLLHLSLTDALTNLHNRRSVLNLLKAEIARCKRHNTELAVVVLDLDHFKHINDRWGHPAGDKVLRAAAECLRATVRDADVVGRFGGEEFLILLPDTGAEGARQLMERCRLALEKLVVLSDHNEAIPVRGSFGIAYSNEGTTPSHESLIGAADRALYRAKQAGRNRVATELATHIPDHHDRARDAALLHRQRLNVYAMLNDLIRGGSHWTPVRRTMLAGYMQLAQFSCYGAWGLLLLIPPNRHQLINVDTVLLSTPVVIAIMVTFALLIKWGKHLNRSNPESPLYQHVMQQFVGFSLIFFGYLIGSLSLPVGIVLVGGPLFGLIFFRGIYVFSSLITSIIALIFLSYASAAGWIPYAPVLPEHLHAHQPVSFIWLIGCYLFITPHMAVIISLADKTFGHWREQGHAVRTLGRTDSLTGVQNRRSITSALEKELARTSRHGPPLAVVLMDLDNFKQINDRWGHPTGDQALKHAAAAVQDCIRDGDAIGRFGGEEFLLILPDTTPEGAYALAERCRIRLERMSLLAEGGQHIAVLASFGVSCNSSNLSCDSATLIRCADQALYLAKNKGRNCVEILFPKKAAAPTPNLA